MSKTQTENPDVVVIHNATVRFTPDSGDRWDLQITADPEGTKVVEMRDAIFHASMLLYDLYTTLRLGVAPLLEALLENNPKSAEAIIEALYVLHGSDGTPLGEDGQIALVYDMASHLERIWEGCVTGEADGEVA